MHSFKSISLLIICCITALRLSAQEKISGTPWQFHSLNNLGLLEGQAASSFQLQSINGMQYRSWFAGLGVGLDFYRYRTIPFFLDIRKEFGNKTNKPFIYMDGGINFPWVTDQEKMSYATNDHFSNGFYTDLGAGYKIKMGKSQALLLSLGYSNKKMTETYPSTFYYYPSFSQQTGNFDTGNNTKINYSLNRLSIKAGWSF